MKFRPDPDHKVPHMGWNTIEKEREVPTLQGIESGDFFYFVHSYYVIPEQKEWIATFTDYGRPFVSSVWKENLFATQFHPEKSQKKGLRILENFVRSI
jgi:glutamine amidotransferase